MNVSADYDKLLEDSTKEELLWLEDEFDLLYKDKMGNCSEMDKIIAKQLVETAVQNVSTIKNNNLKRFLSKTLACIEEKYSNLF